MSLDGSGIKGLVPGSGWYGKRQEMDHLGQALEGNVGTVAPSCFSVPLNYHKLPQDILCLHRQEATGSSSHELQPLILAFLPSKSITSGSLSRHRKLSNTKFEGNAIGFSLD